MSHIRRTHPGYFSVTVGLALAWYLGLGVAFSLSAGTSAASSDAYELIVHYVPLSVWGAVYLLLGGILLVTILVPGAPHIIVRYCCGIGLMLTFSWLAFFTIALATGKMDLISVIPAWLLCACVEWAALTEPETGPQHPGPPGERGSAGRRGTTGERGAPGEKGDPGMPGVKGATGARGATGGEGDEGQEGREGRAGRKGRP